MKVVIVGDGKVGYTLTKSLSEEGHDLVVIDNNKRILLASQESLDVAVVDGNGASVEVQREAGVDTAESAHRRDQRGQKRTFYAAWWRRSLAASTP